MKLTIGAVSFSLLILSALASAPLAQSDFDGLWDATIAIGPADIPFRFEIAQHRDRWSGYFFEGEKRISSTSGSVENGTLKLDYDFLNTTLTATLQGDTLRGVYRANRKNGREYPFRAIRHSTLPSSPAASPQTAGDWEMKLVGDDHRDTKDARAVLSGICSCASRAPTFRDRSSASTGTLARSPVAGAATP